MNLIDSSAWIAYFAGEKNAKHFREIIKDTEKLLVPSIVVYEVFKKILRERNKATAIKYIGHMTEGKVVDCGMTTALTVVGISVKYDLAMADSIILATAQEYSATLWTQDDDFKGIPGVRYFKKN